MSDSDWAAERDSRKSVSAFCLKVGGCLVSWSLKKQPIVALSSTEAKYAAATSTAQEVMHVRTLLETLGYRQIVPADMWCDNQSAIAIARATGARSSFAAMGSSERTPMATAWAPTTLPMAAEAACTQAAAAMAVASYAGGHAKLLAAMAVREYMMTF